LDIICSYRTLDTIDFKTADKAQAQRGRERERERDYENSITQVAHHASDKRHNKNTKFDNEHNFL